MTYNVSGGTLSLTQSITQCHVYVIGLFHLHTCKLIKSMSLCVVDLSLASFRFKAYMYINLRMFDS